MVYEDIADRQRNRFRMFTAAVAGERALAAAAGLTTGAHQQWSRAMQFRNSLIRDAKDELGFYAMMHEPEDERLLERHQTRHVKVLQDILSISSQVITGVNKRDTFGLSALSAARKSTGSIGELAQRRLASSENIRATDSAGRVWKADQLLYVIVRDFAYQDFIDWQFDTAIKDGATKVVLNHPDTTHEFMGTELALDANWLEVRDSTFHVNSQLTIEYGTS